MGWACGKHGEKRNSYRFAIGKTEQRDHLEDPEVDKCIYLNGS
jgi:hypothetical protein